MASGLQPDVWISTQYDRNRGVTSKSYRKSFMRESNPLLPPLDEGVQPVHQVSVCVWKAETVLHQPSRRPQPQFPVCDLGSGQVRVYGTPWSSLTAMKIDPPFSLNSFTSSSNVASGMSGFLNPLL